MPTQVFADPFTGTNGDPPNPADWDVVIAGSGGTETAEIQDNALELTAQESGGTFGDVEVDCREAIGNLLVPRIDFTLVVPNTNRFFANFLVRQNLTRDNAYRLFVRRTGTDLEALLAKNHPVDGQNYAPLLPMSEAVALWNCRVQVTDGPNGPLLQGAVRDASLGAIPEGSWDLEVEDTGATPITAAGSAAASLTEVDGGAQTTVLDDWTVTDLAVTAVQLEGRAIGVGDARATLTATRRLGGRAIGVGDASATLRITHRLSGRAVGVGDASGTLTVTRQLAGRAVGTGDATGRLTVTHRLSGRAIGTGDASGSLTVTHRLSGRAIGTGEARGTLTATRRLSGRAIGVGDARGTLTIGGRTQLSGRAVGTGDARGKLTITHRLSGRAVGQGDARAFLRITHRLAGRAIGIGDARATLSVGDQAGFVLVNRIRLAPAVGLTDIRLSPGVSYAGEMEPAVQIGDVTLTGGVQANAGMAPAVAIESANLELD